MTHIAVVPVAEFNGQLGRALDYAGTLAPRVLAIHIGDEIDPSWDRHTSQVPLVVIDAPPRDRAALVQALEVLRRTEQADLITVVLPAGSPAAVEPSLVCGRGIIVRSVPWPS
jgi:hypothetical protein